MDYIVTSIASFFYNCRVNLFYLLVLQLAPSCRYSNFFIHSCKNFKDWVVVKYKICGNTYFTNDNVHTYNDTSVTRYVKQIYKSATNKEITDELNKEYPKIENGFKGFLQQLSVRDASAYRYRNAKSICLPY